MKIAADTNVLLRAYVADDAAQAATATDILDSAETVAVGLEVLCEFAWVLDRQYEVSRGNIAAAINALLHTANVVVDRPGVEAGLACLAAGGDFADGVIAHQGRWLGGETFVSFDKKAIRLLGAQNLSVKLLT
jgi:predicted nucleic-acid-binding protein